MIYQLLLAVSTICSLCLAISAICPQPLTISITSQFSKAILILTFNAKYLLLLARLRYFSCLAISMLFQSYYVVVSHCFCFFQPFIQHLEPFKRFPLPILNIYYL